ncbi:hypothetical protein GOP47_0018571 [Adiantum capillus-veneris]|uniref:C2 domain-containing protein n=1 Tax=Adiantum capillus-veneris TaxID=13818 RepID=A0A9D4Z9R8_ADICA|nr:hypothetical protein GOP47_0018571 [Adiantum capillus-veneris]
MQPFSGILQVKIIQGSDLAPRDLKSADPYVLLSIGDQKVKTPPIRRSLNPVWEQDLTLGTSEPVMPLKLFVFDKNTFTSDDEMGEAQIDLTPLIGAVKLKEQAHTTAENVVIHRVVASKENSLARDSIIKFRNGTIVQECCVKLQNVERGEIELELMWQPYCG